VVVQQSAEAVATAETIERRGSRLATRTPKAVGATATSTISCH
jgi:hypothetical protein